MNQVLERAIASAPDAPGVYVMKDGAGRALYVGKAMNLRERLRAYASGADRRPFVRLLPRLLGAVEVMVVGNEKEALLLENELIRQLKPRFNARPALGRNFVYLRLDPRERYPRLEVTRTVRADGAHYFGPYPLARALRETLRVINRHFKLRTCSEHDPAHHTRPCVLCQIARFPAPSVYDIPPERYRENVAAAIRFLEGDERGLLEELRARMEAAAAAMRFEEAARLRDQIAAIERVLEPQEIVVAEPRDIDAFGLAAGARPLVYVVFVRKGRVIGGRAIAVERQAVLDAEGLAAFLALLYGEGAYLPDEILLPCEIEGREALAAVLSERRGAPVAIRRPMRGWRRQLVRMASRNAEEAARRGAPAQGGDALERLRERLGLARPPRRIEAFDVSHFGGEAIVAASVAMSDGRLDKDRYRRYRIVTARPADDYAALYEVVYRRLRRGQAEGDLPDLLVIDGGRGQLASALAALRDLGLDAEVAAIAIAKGREGAASERIYLPGRRQPIVLAPGSPERLLLDRLRDEAHRFAIAYQRRLWRRRRLASELEAIPGVGPERRRRLLRHFGSLEGVRAASPAELARVPGIGAETARRLYAHLHPQHEAASHG